MNTLEGFVPDISTVVDSLDRVESWTKSIDEMPDEFNVLVSKLPALATFPPSDEDSLILDRLPRVLSQVSSSVFASCMITLERGVFTDRGKTGLSWASLLYLQCKIRDVDGSATPEERLINSRFETIIRYIQSGNMVMDSNLSEQG